MKNTNKCMLGDCFVFTPTEKRIFAKRLLVLCGTMLLAWYISAYWVQLAIVEGDSMLPAYHNMQFVLIDKHTKDYKSGDVIAFRCGNLSSNLIKRIVGIPGDTMIIENGRLYVNGRLIDEDTYYEYTGIMENKIKLSNGEYIVLGDNVSESKDSRYREIGIIDICDIVGEVI